MSLTATTVTVTVLVTVTVTGAPGSNTAHANTHVPTLKGKIDQTTERLSTYVLPAQ